MIVYECRITGHEFITDSFNHEDIGVPGLFKVRSAFISEGGGSIAGVADAEDGEDAVMVNNVESAANLQELTPPPSKKEFKEWFVEFAKRVRKNLKEDPEKGPTEAKAWIARTKGILGWINENYADIQFYTNSDFDMDGCMCFAIYQSDKDFYFMSDALKAVKF